MVNIVPSSLFTIKVTSKGPFMAGTVGPKVVAALYRALLLAARPLTQMLVDATPVGVTSRLKKWKTKKNPSVPSIEIYNDTKYFPWVENGRKAGPVPFKVMELWVRKKLGLSGREAAQRAYFICRKKARSYTPGQKFTQKTIESQRDKIKRTIEALSNKEISIEVQ